MFKVNFQFVVVEAQKIAIHLSITIGMLVVRHFVILEHHINFKNENELVYERFGIYVLYYAISRF